MSVLENFSQEGSLSFVINKAESAFMYALLEAEEHLMSYTTSEVYAQEVQITLFFAKNREKEVKAWFKRLEGISFYFS